MKLMWQVSWKWYKRDQQENDILFIKQWKRKKLEKAYRQNIEKKRRKGGKESEGKEKENEGDRKDKIEKRIGKLNKDRERK